MNAAATALWASIVRTLVPLIAGGVITWLVSLGIDLDDQFSTALNVFLYALFSALYYIGARLAETYVTPKLGWLLGLAKSPDSYTAKHSA